MSKTRKSGMALMLCLSCALMVLAGCVSDDEFAKTVTQFAQASTTLTQDFTALVSNANAVEENHYIDEQVFNGKVLDPKDIEEQDLLTPDEIALRAGAIKALSDYMTALGSLAAGKPAAQIEADAKKAGTSLSTLSGDATKTFAGAATAKKIDFSKPLSAAIAAAGDVLDLIEKHRAMDEIRASITKNDPAITELFQMLSKESKEFYDREKTAVGSTGGTLFHNYDAAAKKSPADQAELMQWADRIKQYRKDAAALATSDPTKAIDAFQTAHEKLVDAIQAPKQEQKEKLSDVVAAIKSFATEVQPLAVDTKTLAGSL